MSYCSLPAEELISSWLCSITALLQLGTGCNLLVPRPWVLDLPKQAKLHPVLQIQPDTTSQIIAYSAIFQPGFVHHTKRTAKIVGPQRFLVKQPPTSYSCWLLCCSSAYTSVGLEYFFVLCITLIPSLTKIRLAFSFKGCP